MQHNRKVKESKSAFASPFRCPLDEDSDDDEEGGFDGGAADTVEDME